MNNGNPAFAAQLGLEDLTDHNGLAMKLFGCDFETLMMSYKQDAKRVFFMYGELLNESGVRYITDPDGWMIDIECLFSSEPDLVKKGASESTDPFYHVRKRGKVLDFDLLQKYKQGDLWKKRNQVIASFREMRGASSKLGGRPGSVGSAAMAMVGVAIVMAIVGAAMHPYGHGSHGI